MPMVCPQCRGTFDGPTACPRCGVRLQAGVAAARRKDPQWHQTPAGRIAAGLLLSVGLGFGLLQLCMGSLEHFLPQEARDGKLPPALGLGLFVGLQAIAVVAGAAVAGAGMRRGAVVGMLIGLVTSAAALVCIRMGALIQLVQPLVGDLMTAGSPNSPLLFDRLLLRLAVLYGLPAVLFLCGVVGGTVGSWIWKPPPTLELPVFRQLDNRPESSASRHAYRPPPRTLPSGGWGGRVAWLRIIGGLVVAAVGAAFSPQLLRLLLDLSGAKGVGAYQATIATRGVYGFALFLGACVAGANTPNGLKQGFLLGLVGAMAQGGMYAAREAPDEGLVYVAVLALVLGPIGGWFGSSLLPPAEPASGRA